MGSRQLDSSRAPDSFLFIFILLSSSSKDNLSPYSTFNRLGPETLLLIFVVLSIYETVIVVSSQIRPEGRVKVTFRDFFRVPLQKETRDENEYLQQEF